MTVCAAGIALLLHGVTWAGVRDDEAAAVKVFKEVSANQVVYTYSVTNKGDRPIIGLTVGHDYYRGDTQLAGAHPTQILSPTTWAGRVVALEESDNYEVSWDIAVPTAAILPGKTMTGFRIIAAKDNPRFTSSNWTVIVDGPPSNASSALQLVQGPAPNVDTVPPQLHVTLTPNVVWPPNRRMVNIAARITAQDDTDPNPRACSRADASSNEVRLRRTKQHRPSPCDVGNRATIGSWRSGDLYPLNWRCIFDHLDLRPRCGISDQQISSSL